MSGSRRLPVVLPLLMFVGMAFGGWMIYLNYWSPERALERAHAGWDSNDTQQRIDAISKYKELLRKADPLEPGTRWLKDDRDTLYRRIIFHQLKFEKDERAAGEWVIAAWDEQIRDLRFQDEEVRQFWTDTIEQLTKRRNRKANDAAEPESDSATPLGRLDELLPK